MNSCEAYLIHLLDRALKDSQPDGKPDDVDWDDLFVLARRHLVSGLAAVSVERLIPAPGPAVRKRWTDAREQDVYLDLLQRSELARMEQALAAAGIRCLPLKGSVLKACYPRPEMRTMSDIDLLVDAENMKKVHDLLVTDGYTCTHEDVGIHDTYTRRPGLMVEIHRGLFADVPELAALHRYDQAFDLARSDPEDPCLYRLPPEELYGYVLAHAYKHYVHGGSGIRSVMDIHILEKRGGLDEDRLQALVTEMGLGTFRRTIRALGSQWFEGEPGTDEAAAMSVYILSGGAYGSVAQAAGAGMERMGRGRYLVYRIFPPLARMRYGYAVLRQWPVLLPFCWVHRWFSSLVHKQARIREELGAVFGQGRKEKGGSA